MAMTIPTIPTLPAGYVVQVADMNNLASCANFLYNKPVCRITDTTGAQTIAAGTTLSSTNAIQFTSANFDPDGMWSSGSPKQLTIQTPGYYKVRYGVSVKCTTAATKMNAGILMTTGANNPVGAGSVIPPAWASFSQMVSTNDQAASFGSGVYPFYLYAGDIIQVCAVWDGGVLTTVTTNGGSWLSLELVSI